MYHCPLAEVWKREDCTEAGRCYCEELAHSLLDAYTDGRGQANVSNSMTCDRDFFCRFAFYLRPANMVRTRRNNVLETGERKVDVQDSIR